MNTAIWVVGSAIVYSFLAILAYMACVQVIELIRRWFFKVEYPCYFCGGRFTLLEKHSWDLCSGTFYKVFCLRCQLPGPDSVKYYFGTGRTCGVQTFKERWSKSAHKY